MDTYTLTRRVGRMLVWTTAERYIGMMICLHFNKKRQSIQITKEKIASECGFEQKTVQSVIKKLVDAGLFERKRVLGVETLFPLNSNLNHLENEKSLSDKGNEAEGFRSHGQNIPCPRNNQSVATEIQDTGKNTGRVEVTPMSLQKCQPGHIGVQQLGRDPFDYDITHSSLPEERCKRIDAQPF